MATIPEVLGDLEICGGEFVNAPCVIGGNLISGRTFHDNGMSDAWISYWKQSEIDAPAAD
ncbi:MAG: hypothetical protein U0892_04095 [Pirellulales bacterium]